MNPNPNELPGSPPSQQPGPGTQMAGQQTAPTTTVPHGPMTPAYTPAGTRTNQLAIVSLVTGIGSFAAHIIPGVGGFTVALIAVITGYMARQQIKETGENGMGIATAGMVIGLIHIVVIFLGVLLLIFFIFVVGIALFGISVHSGSAPTPTVQPTG